MEENRLLERLLELDILDNENEVIKAEKEMEEELKKLDEIIREIDIIVSEDKTIHFQCQSLEELKEEYSKNEDNKDVALRYVIALEKRALLEDNSETRSELIETSNKLLKKHDLTKLYIEISAIQLCKKNEIRIEEKLDVFSKLYESHKNSMPIGMSYSHSIFGLFEKLEPIETIEETKIEEYSQKYNKSSIIAIYYANILLSKSMNNANSNTESISKMADLLEREYNPWELGLDDIILIFLENLVCIEASQEILKLSFHLIYKIVSSNMFTNCWDLAGIVNYNYEKKGDYLQNILKIYLSAKSILHKLSVKNDEKNTVQLYHYTKIDIMHKFLERVKKNRRGEHNENVGDELQKDNDGKFWMFNANYMNDPMEGKTFLQMLRKGIEERGNPLLELEYYNAPNIFFASFSSEEDILPMWQQYGGSCEGCSIRFENNFDCAGKETDHVLLFEIRNEKENEAFSQDKINAPQEITQKEEKIFLYHICYIDQKDTKDIYYIDGKEVKESKVKEERTIVNDIIDIKEAIKAIETLKENDNDGIYKNAYKDIMLCLDKVRYLFKSVDYMYEKEIRLLKQVRIDDKEIQSIQIGEEAAPRLYYVNPKKIKVEEIVLGPKVKDTDILVPYIFYCDKEIKVKKSSINFR